LIVICPEGRRELPAKNKTSENLSKLHHFICSSIAPIACNRTHPASLLKESITSSYLSDCKLLLRTTKNSDASNPLVQLSYQKKSSGSVTQEATAYTS
jgi:hypothetical protein